MFSWVRRRYRITRCMLLWITMLGMGTCDAAARASSKPGPKTCRDVVLTWGGTSTSPRLPRTIEVTCQNLAPAQSQVSFIPPNAEIYTMPPLMEYIAMVVTDDVFAMPLSGQVHLIGEGGRFLRMLIHLSEGCPETIKHISIHPNGPLHPIHAPSH